MYETGGEKSYKIGEKIRIAKRKIQKNDENWKKRNMIEMWKRGKASMQKKKKLKRGKGIGSQCETRARTWRSRKKGGKTESKTEKHSGRKIFYALYCRKIASLTITLIWSGKIRTSKGTHLDTFYYYFEDKMTRDSGRE